MEGLCGARMVLEAEVRQCQPGISLQVRKLQLFAAFVAPARQTALSSVPYALDPTSLPRDTGPRKHGWLVLPA